jgi:hypothetical protein
MYVTFIASDDTLQYPPQELFDRSSRPQPFIHDNTEYFTDMNVTDALKPVLRNLTSLELSVSSGSVDIRVDDTVLTWGNTKWTVDLQNPKDNPSRESTG